MDIRYLMGSVKILLFGSTLFYNFFHFTGKMDAFPYTVTVFVEHHTRYYRPIVQIADLHSTHLKALIHTMYHSCDFPRFMFFVLAMLER